jgi:hypothetical protein
MLLEQRTDLSTAIDDLIHDIEMAISSWKYTKNEMYNDDELNPVLYQNKKKYFRPTSLKPSRFEVSANLSEKQWTYCRHEISSAMGDVAMTVLLKSVGRATSGTEATVISATILQTVFSTIVPNSTFFCSIVAKGTKISF